MQLKVGSIACGGLTKDSSQFFQDRQSQASQGREIHQKSHHRNSCKEYIWGIRIC